MTVDKDKLRQAANKAESYGQTRSEYARQARAAFTTAANPATVLALLDEIAAMTKARDEACDWLMESAANARAFGRNEEAEDVESIISALRKVGTHD